MKFDSQIFVSTDERNILSAPHYETTASLLSEFVRRETAKADRRRLVVGLSGGVDSSLVVSAMGPAKVFSIGFDDTSYNELTYAKRVADHLGAEHVTEVVRPDAADLFDPLMHFMDDPIGDFSIFPTYLIARLARNHVTVALSGDGGDELFGGYDTYLAQRYARWYRYLPAAVRQRWLPAFAERLPPGEEKKGARNKLKRFIEGARYPERLRHARWRLFASDAMKATLLTTEARASLKTTTEAHIATLFGHAGSRSPLDQQLYTDLKSYLSDNCLVKVDRMSMANSLEVRVPLLDKDLVELAFRIPESLKISGARTKRVLKRVAARHVPRASPRQGSSKRHALRR